MKAAIIDVKTENRRIKGSSLMGQDGGPPTNVDTENGKIIRIRPYIYDENRDFETLHPWKIRARGQEFGPPKKAVVSCMGQTYKKRVYSNNRVRYPLKTRRLGSRWRTQHAEQGQEPVCPHLVGRGGTAHLRRTATRQ